jgi:hypothetical protein
MSLQALTAMVMKKSVFGDITLSSSLFKGKGRSGASCPLPADETNRENPGRNR